MTKQYEEWQDDLLPKLKGADWAIVEEELRSAIQEFFERSRIWRVESIDYTPQNVVADQSLYTVTVPANTLLVDIADAWFNDNELTPSMPRELDVILPGWRTNKAVAPTLFYRPDDYTVRLVLTPNTSATSALRFSTILKPTIDAPDVPDWVYDQHREAIEHGTLARLYRMAGKPWSAPALAKDNRGEFDALINKQRNLKRKGNLRRNAMGVTPREYGF